MIVEATTPYPWPYDRGLTPSSTALVICGTGPSWTARTPLDAPIEANLATLRTVAAELALLTVLIVHDPITERPPQHLPAQPCAPLVPRAGERTITAAGTDGFYGSSLDRVLHRAGRTHLLLAGFGFETTVHSTLRRANDRGYECLTVADACLTIDPALRASAISTIELSGGIFGAVGQTAEVVTALQRAATDRHAPSGAPLSGATPPEQKDRP